MHRTKKAPVRNEESEADAPGLLDALLNASSEGLCILSPEGVCLEMNQAYEQLMGIHRSSWIGRSGGEMREEFGFTGQSTVERVRRGASSATTLVKTNGDMLLTTANAYRGAHGQLRYIIVNIRNVTHLDNLTAQAAEQQGHGKFVQVNSAQERELISRLQVAGYGHATIASPVMKKVVSIAARIADSGATALLYGETGTGKGLIARLIHDLSERSRRPFVEVDCGAIPDTLVESELFGYEAGAFTGTSRTGKKGKLELAASGTTFLDEVGELSLSSQAKLLKFLDDKTVYRLGGTVPRVVDTRVLAATNKDLHDEVKKGRFRDDLLYRLEVLPLHIPPLRERSEDIKSLLHSFLEEINLEFKEQRRLSNEASKCLLYYSYPGNIRELRNIVSRLVLTSRRREIGIDDIPEHLRKRHETSRAHEPTVSLEGYSLRQKLEEFEKQILSEAAQRCRSTYEIGKEIGVDHSTIVRKLKKHRISISGRNAHDE